ncbi:MAG: hypothetical protein CMI18_09025 [Opitutaceae bacterium]|nr:hypothetical protein [Opitutaceae bacterium]
MQEGSNEDLALSFWSTLQGLFVILLDHCVSQGYLDANAPNQLVNAAPAILLQGFQNQPLN